MFGRLNKCKNVLSFGYHIPIHNNNNDDDNNNDNNDNNNRPKPFQYYKIHN